MESSPTWRPPDVIFETAMSEPIHAGKIASVAFWTTFSLIGVFESLAPFRLENDPLKMAIPIGRAGSVR
jgi:hypothetical protein